MRKLGGPRLDPRQPWLWPERWQALSSWGAVALGVLLATPWWFSAWAAWTDAQQLAQTFERTQADTRSAELRRLQLDQDLAQRLLQASASAQTLTVELPTVTQTLTHSAAHESLALSLVDWGVAVPVSGMSTQPLQQVAVHLQLQGTWRGWMRWWTHLPSVAPWVTLSTLDLRAQPNGGWRAHLVLRIPQRVAHAPHAWQLAGLDDAAESDPMDVHAWQRAQTQQAQQHPSYARWIAPELQRVRAPLEALPRERLHYVGQISQAGVLQALLRSSQAGGVVTHAPIYRVSVGDYVGQDFGRVQAIAADQLTLRELVRDAHGVWQPRDVTLPLEEGAK